MKLPSLWHFQDQFLTTSWGELMRKVLVFDVSRAVRITRFESVSESQPNSRYKATKLVEGLIFFLACMLSTFCLSTMRVISTELYKK